MVKKQIIGVVSPNKNIFNQFIREQLPEHPRIEYKRITIEDDISERFTKVINGYGYQEVNLKIRLKAYRNKY